MVVAVWVTPAAETRLEAGFTEDLMGTQHPILSCIIINWFIPFNNSDTTAAHFLPYKAKGQSRRIWVSRTDSGSQKPGAGACVLMERLEAAAGAQLWGSDDVHDIFYEK